MPRKARNRIGRDYREEIGTVALASGAEYSREHFIRFPRRVRGNTQAIPNQAVARQTA
jgi:hypothetical protein